MDIKTILNVFSNRFKNDKPIKEININKETRNRIIMIIQNSFEKGNSNTFYSDETIRSFPTFLVQIRELFLFKLGRFRLYEDKNLNECNDMLNFIQNCKGEYFLDFLEYIFQTKCFKGRDAEFQNKIVCDINYILQQGGINFRLTNYIDELIEKRIAYPPINAKTRSVVSYPQIINYEDDFTYSEMLLPTLELLKDKRFRNANNEFLESLEHYKNNRYKECITSCCSSIESTIKVIFNIRNIEFNANCTLAPLVDKIIEKTNLYEGLKNALISPATVRNKLGSAHGKGNKEIVADKEQARYQINITAAEIILLANELL